MQIPSYWLCSWDAQTLAFRLEVSCWNKRLARQDSETVKNLMAKVKRKWIGISFDFNSQNHVSFHQTKVGVGEKKRTKQATEMPNSKRISNGVWKPLKMLYQCSYYVLHVSSLDIIVGHDQYRLEYRLSWITYQQII